MKVTNQGRIRPVVGVGWYLQETGPSGQVLVSNGSNGVAWASNVQHITSNGSNVLIGPFVNFASGSNIIFTLDAGPGGSVPSNTLRIHAVTSNTGGGGSSSLTISDEGTPLSTAATTLDFVGAGVTASGTGATKTITIPGVGSSVVHEDFWTPPDSAGTYDEEFAGTADTLPTNWSWTTEPTGSNNWKLNSQWKRCIVINRTASDTSTFDLRRTSLTPGAADVGFWWYMALGMGRWNNNTETIEVLFRDSSGNAGFGIRIQSTSTLVISSRDRTGGVTSDVVQENTTNNDTRQGIFCGVTRKTSDNTWRAYISGGDGRHWEAIGVTTTRSVTIDHMQVTFASGGNQGFSRYIFGPLRSRADLLPWAPR